MSLGLAEMPIEACFPQDLIDADEHLSKGRCLTQASPIPSSLSWLSRQLLQRREGDKGLISSLEAPFINAGEEPLFFLAPDQMAEIAVSPDAEREEECEPEAKELVRQAISHLTSRQQEIVLLIGCTGMSVGDVADKFGVDKGDIIVSFGCAMDILRMSELEEIKNFVVLAEARKL